MPGKCKPVQDVQLYCVNRGSWTELCVDLPYGFLDGKKLTFYIDGFFYWYADAGDCDLVLKDEIVAFDMSQETFSMTKVPDKCCVENNYRRRRTLTELKNRVAMIHYTPESSNITCNIWVLLEFGAKES